ncbi:MAG: hypothetical protein ACPG1C_04980 [Alphaproteobacteria bacterium]
MTDAQKNLDDKTPILVGAGQYVERQATPHGPMYLASQAAAGAVADCGAPNIAAHIDTIGVIRLFSDSLGPWTGKHGRSNNPPQSIAKAIGASPKTRIYSPVGGNEPLSLLIECAKDIAEGKKEMALIAGSEAIKNQRQADRDDQTLSWDEVFDEPFDDRLAPPSLLTVQERYSGLATPIRTYSLFDQARRHAQRADLASYSNAMAALMAPLSEVAAQNPYAQFPESYSADDIAKSRQLTHMYTGRMVARDAVNLGAAVLVCSVGKAKQLAIPQDRWVFLHGLAEGKELRPSERPNLATSPMAGKVVDRALDLAEKDIAGIDGLDIYSCFPCAVSMLTDHLGIPTDGSRALTLTGGLPYLGGPGNNYSMHALAEALWRCRQRPDDFTLVTCNGGFLSKHATGVFSAVPSLRDWSRVETRISQSGLDKKPLATHPTGGRIISYAVDYWGSDTPTGACVLAETDTGERFICTTAEGDNATAASFADADDLTGRLILTRPANVEQETFHFALSL